MLKYIVILGALVNLAGTLVYLVETVKGKIKPNRVSWLLWSIAPLIATAAMLADGVTWAALPVFMVGFCPLLVFFATFVNKQAYWKLTKFDYLCGIFSVLALVLWLVTKNPNVAIAFALLSDLFAGIPTFVKAWNHPETETPIAYVVSVFNAATSFFAIETWTFSSYSFPIYLLIMNSLIIFAIKRKRVRD